MPDETQDLQTEQGFTVQIPMANERDLSEGWTISYQFLSEIERKTRDSEHVYPEAVEDVLLGLFNIPRNPKALLAQPHDAE